MRVIFAGTPEFAVPSLKMLLASGHSIPAVYTRPDRPAGRGRRLQQSPVKALALAAGIEVVQPQSFREPDEIRRLAGLQPDLVIVIAYGLILPQAVLDIPRCGCINVHASLLPRWRGAAPIQRALMAGDAKTGVTIMRIIKKLDAGDMLHKEEYRLNARDTADSVHDRLAELGAIGLAKVLPGIEAGTVEGEPQDERLATYAAKLEKSEAVIDWSQPCERIARQIRGMNSWPVAQTVYRGQILRIWQAEALPEHDAAGLPGQVSVAGANIDVAAGQGRLRLLEVQLPGGRRMAAGAFVNAHRLNGVRLG